MIKKMYRVFEEKNNLPYTLFHGNFGRRQLMLDEWIDADIKPVMDGTHGKVYNSGFHVLEDMYAVTSFFLKKFRILKHRVVCVVEVDTDAGIWKKNKEVYLVKRMRINSADWKNRIKL